MSSPTAPPGSSDDDALRSYAERLADAIEAALPKWVERSVERVAEAWQPGLGDRLSAAARIAGRDAVTEVGPRVRALLRVDVDRQTTGPLDLCRAAVRYPTEVLRSAGVPYADRDEFAVRMFPDDGYDLSPANFGAIDESVAEPGLVWGAAKAHVVLARRRSEGMR